MDRDEHTPSVERSGVVIQFRSRARSDEAGPLLQCVSSGYMSGGCSCERTVPAEAASAAWSVERAREAGRSGFFQFVWRGQTWIGFGLSDGAVRGVYCPTHRAEREARAVGCEAQHYAPARIALGA